MTDKQEAKHSSKYDPKTGLLLQDGIRWRADKNAYQYRVRYQVLGKWAEVSGLQPTLHKAKRAYEKVKNSKNISGSLTLIDWHSEYWAVIEDSIRASTSVSYEIAWRKRIRPSLGHLKLSQINPTRIERAMTAWSGSASTKHDAIAVLSRLLYGAELEGLIANNPALLIKKPRIEQGISPRSRALSKKEIKTFLTLIPTGIYKSFAMTLVLTGMRIGEVSALRVCDLDLDSGLITVQRSFSAASKGRLVESTPKSHKSREVAITDDLQPILSELTKNKKLTERVFNGPRGGVINASNFRRAVDWQNIRETLGRPDLRVHDLRHTYATILFEAGVPAPDVQAALGHSSLQVTERYSTARGDAAKRVGSALNLFLK